MDEVLCIGGEVVEEDQERWDDKSKRILASHNDREALRDVWYTLLMTVTTTTTTVNTTAWIGGVWNVVHLFSLASGILRGGPLTMCSMLQVRRFASETSRSTRTCKAPRSSSQHDPGMLCRAA